MAPEHRSSVKPNLAVTRAQAQEMVARVAGGRTVTTVTELHGGEIGAVYRVDFADQAASVVLKVFPGRCTGRCGRR